nr:probable tRNA-splicing endonuclease subunit sen34 [Onthophagus taurus]
MITIYVDNNVPCIYKIEDWEILRKTYRIIGNPLGTNFCIPSLPVSLLPEEALILKRKGIVKLITLKQILNTEPRDNQEKAYNDFKVKLIKAQKEMYRDIRKKQIELNIKKLIAGKRKKGDDRCEQEIFEEELEKSCCIAEDSMLWPIFCEHQITSKDCHDEVGEDVLLAKTTQTKLTIYEDLWNRGFYITVGNKFGADFLVYLGDPVLHHAVYIVIIVENPKKLFYPSELVAYGRLGTSVKKKTLLASLMETGKVSYLTLNWMDD